MYVAGQSLEKKSNKKKIGAVVVGVALTMSVAVYGISAYLTDTKEATNKFSVDTDFKIELSEPSWAPDTDFDADGKKDGFADLYPTQVISKDPTITNTSSKMNAWAAMDVKVPVFSGTIFNSDGGKQTVNDQDLYSFTKKEGWTLANTSPVAGGYRTYTYIYDSPLAPNAKATLFETIKVANLASTPTSWAADNPDAAKNQIVVNAYGIQESSEFNTAQAAYDAYVKQEATVAAG